MDNWERLKNDEEPLPIEPLNMMEHVEPIWVVDVNYQHDLVMLLTFSNDVRSDGTPIDVK